MEAGEVFGIIIGTLTVIFFAGRHLISYASKKAEENEKLKKENNDNALRRLGDQVVNFRAAVTSLETKLENHALKIGSNSSEIKVLYEKLRSTERMIDTYNKTADDTVRNMIKTEVTNLTKQLMLLRNKKNGDG